MIRSVVLAASDSTLVEPIAKTLPPDTRLHLVEITPEKQLPSTQDLLAKTDLVLVQTKQVQALEPWLRHNDTGEDNADAHIKRQIMGREIAVVVTEGRLDFGTWEQIFYGEFDGRRRKRVLVKIIGE